MSLADDLDEFFEGTGESIVQEPLRFKSKLGIGEKAYFLVRQRENMTTFSEAIGVGATASSLAGSSLVASTFFAKTGVLATALTSVGLGTAAVTPLGWVIGAGLLVGGGYLGVSRIFESPKDSGVVIVPKYINTPLDVIAIALVELMLPISLKIANSDGEIADSERVAIEDFFVSEWGYSKAFIKKLVEEYETEIELISYPKLAESLTAYCDSSKDCEPGAIAKDFILHLARIIEADGEITQAELTELQYIKEILPSRDHSGSVRDWLGSVGGTVSKGASEVSHTAKNVFGAAAQKVGSGTKTIRKFWHKSPDETGGSHT
ncbi:hypothetical protein F0M18_00360 [Pseudohalioglobus sediminis]|uniref:Co-chaperone DjlA N-terminal domain-containing protein n=1 Tax=Pseudohalioglobus sediminis TaxID=2606449 RepID=A0A5B0X3I1_9GAMM|nr:TerB family tellurite resistance protein [Pseudohalioglobus sediminis]KAA1193934.1 hypothetical protein F0M18_00360 [Pseudohalioglobus sediminis]